MDDQRRWRGASGVLLCLGIATIVHAAQADEATGTAGAGAAGTAAPSTGTSVSDNGAQATPGSAGPMFASPSVLPATGAGAAGPDVRVGNLGNQLNNSLSAGRPLEPSTRAWTITPSIGLAEEYTTSSGAGTGGSGSVGSQLVTVVQPGLVASGDTTRLHGEVSYTPQILLYVPDGNQNQVAQDFNARLLATILPQTLFLDVRGSGAVQAVTAGQAPNQTSTLARGNTTQTYSYSVSPYALHRFDDWGTAEIGGYVARTAQNALQPATNQPLLAALAEASNQNVTITSAHAGFLTGEAFARYSGAALAQATNFDGTGVLNSAYRDTVTLDNGYAITRTITALATIGWENIHYSGTSPLTIDDAIWSVGVRLEPNTDSTITVRYGHQDGLNSLLVDAAYQPTARTRIYARTSTGLTTQAEQLQNALATSDLDTQGNPIDHTTGAPLVPVGNFFGSQNSLYKTTLTSLTGVLLLDRDSISASVTDQIQTLVSASNVVGLATGNTSGVYGTLSWSHELRPNMQSTVYVQYGKQRNEGVLASQQQLAVASATLSRALSPTLSGMLQYSYSQTFGYSQAGTPILGSEPAGNGSQSLFLLSLIKSF
jgi:uncharacterized protein (PEP-CTERM system associated)